MKLKRKANGINMLFNNFVEESRKQSSSEGLNSSFRFDDSWRHVAISATLPSQPSLKFSIFEQDS